MHQGSRYTREILHLKYQNTDMLLKGEKLRNDNERLLQFHLSPIQQAAKKAIVQASNVQQLHNQNLILLAV